MPVKGGLMGPDNIGVLLEMLQQLGIKPPLPGDSSTQLENFKSRMGEPMRLNPVDDSSASGRYVNSLFGNEFSRRVGRNWQGVADHFLDAKGSEDIPQLAYPHDKDALWKNHPWSPERQKAYIELFTYFLDQADDDPTLSEDEKESWARRKALDLL